MSKIVGVELLVESLFLQTPAGIDLESRFAEIGVIEKCKMQLSRATLPLNGACLWRSISEGCALLPHVVVICDTAHFLCTIFDSGIDAGHTSRFERALDLTREWKHICCCSMHLAHRSLFFSAHSDVSFTVILRDIDKELLAYQKRRCSALDLQVQ